jgi:hypothetical protein
MVNYAISYKGISTRIDELGKLTLDERRRLVFDKLRNFFSDKELNEIESSNKYVLIDDSGNQVVYVLVPHSL